LPESLPQSDEVRELCAKLADELRNARFFVPEAPPQTYGLTPLDFAPVPVSCCRKLFADAAIRDHLKALEDGQEEDGGWPISREPPGGAAVREWRAYRTLKALVTLESCRRAGISGRS
jgi:hypothetical protein